MSWQTLETDNKWNPFPDDPSYQQFKHECEKAANTEKDLWKEIDYAKRHILEQYVKEKEYIKLKSEYRGMYSYFYDPVHKIIYKTRDIREWTSSPQSMLEMTYDTNIMKWNNLD